MSSGNSSRPREGALESFTEDFDTIIEHFNHEWCPVRAPSRFFAWESLKLHSYTPTWLYVANITTK